MSTTTLRGWAVLGAAVLAVSTMAPLAAHAAPPEIKDDPITLETGHIDAFNLVLDDETDDVYLTLKEDVTGSHVLRTPESVTLKVRSQAIVSDVPGGVPSAVPSTFWMLPLTQDRSLIWPGWDSQSVSPRFGAQADVDIDVDVLSAPAGGEVFLWTSGSWGEPAPLLTEGRYQFPGTIHQSFLAHVHANWAFTQPGTYTLRAQATVTSDDGSDTATTNSAEYTFVVAPVPESVTVTGAEDAVAEGSDLTLTASQAPEGAEFHTYAWQTRASESGEWDDIPDEDSSTLTVSATNGAQYRATVSGGVQYEGTTPLPMTVTSEPVSVQTIVDTEHELSLAPLSHHYHQGSPIELEATLDPALDGATYRWYVQRTDQDAPVQLAGVTGPTHTLTAEQALNGATVHAEALDADGDVIATSDSVTIDVDDHGAAPFNVVSINGLADHYHSGDAIELTASVDPASVLDTYRWTLTPVGGDPTTHEGNPLDLTASAELNGATVVAELVFDNGDVYVASQPVTIEIDDHGHEPGDPEEVALTVTGLKDSYAPGETLELTAVPEPDTDLDHYHWFITRAGSDTEEVIEDAYSNTLSLPLTAAEDGASIVVRLYNDDHSVAGESAPVTISVENEDATTPPGTNDPSDDPDGDDPGPGGNDPDDPDSPGGDDPDGDDRSGGALEEAATGADVLPLTLMGALLVGAGVLALRRSRTLS